MPADLSPPASLPINYASVFTGQERALEQLRLEVALNNEVVGSILVLDTERRLRHGAAPSLPDIYNRAIDGIEIGPFGTCCAAAHRNEVVVTTDIEHDPGWAKLKDYPLAIRLRAAWSCPIRAADGRVLGTFGTYFHECRAPTEIERELVPMLARTAALAIEQREKSAGYAKAG